VIRAAPTRSGGRWALTDDTGTLLLRGAADDGGGIPGLDVLLAVSAGGPIDVTVEWTPSGVVPLTIHTAGNDSSVTSIDIGPRAEPSFVGAA
jgi:hypothetical protein